MLIAVWACQMTAAGLAAEAKKKACVLLQGGTIYDGSGGEGVKGDVAIRDGKIAAVGQFDPAQAERVVDCRGLIVAPGFIDLHTHCDPVATDAKVRPNLNYLRQGCTTVVTGNCGGGALDVEEYFTRIDRQGAGTNVIHLVPHGTARAKAMGSDDREPTAEELQRIREFVERGMRAGAWGMSSGLIYVPSMFAKTDELIDLTKIVAAHGGIYVSHIRGEGSGLLQSVQEAIDIGRAAGAQVQISHFKVAGKSNWGLLRKAASLVEDARGKGQVIFADQYPYIATSTGLAPTLFSPKVIPGGVKDFAKRIQNDPQFKSEVHKTVARQLDDIQNILIATCKKYPQYVGKTLKQIADERGIDAADVAIEIQANGSASVIKFALCEDDVRYGMTLPWVATGSDGSPQIPSPSTSPHPRSYGTFPRKIGYYAMREKVISVGRAIRSATGLPADILKLADRGYLRTGLVADLVVFDPETFIDRATFEKPHQYATGVRYVFIGGQAAIDNGNPSSELYGRAIRHSSGK
jgi:N-acyl-D-aspartate/D-glutamate deacylase